MEITFSFVSFFLLVVLTRALSFDGSVCETLVYCYKHWQASCKHLTVGWGIRFIDSIP